MDEKNGHDSASRTQSSRSSSDGPTQPLNPREAQQPPTDQTSTHEDQKEVTPARLEQGDKDTEKQPTQSEQKAKDPNLVEFDGPSDPLNPKTWSFKRRWLATGLVSLVTFMTPIASSMIAPAEEYIDKSLHVTSTFETQLIFSIFLLAFVIGPLFLAPLSEVYGRVIVLQLANIFFLIFNFACGFSQNGAQILAFRFLSGLGACAPQTIGGGVLSDLWTSEERGKAVALYTLAPLLGPSAGPLIGAWIAERASWRWCFWAVTIFGVIVQVLIYFTLDETYAPRILQLKAARLRKETGNQAWHTQWESADRRLTTILPNALKRVFIMLFTQPIVIFLASYMSLIYGIIYLQLSTFPRVWTKIYNESTGIGGLNYISLLIGLTLGAQTSGRLLDLVYKKLKARAPDGEGKPEMRIPILFASTFILASGLFMFGWSAQAHAPWIVPDIGIGIFAVGTTMTFTGLQVYTIDSYQLYAASAVGATAVARSVTGFAFPLFADYMFDALGEGWGNSILGFAVLVIGYTGAFVLWFHGARLRKMSRYAADK